MADWKVHKGKEAARGRTEATSDLPQETLCRAGLEECLCVGREELHATSPLRYAEDGEGL